MQFNLNKCSCRQFLLTLCVKARANTTLDWTAKRLLKHLYCALHLRGSVITEKSRWKEGGREGGKRREETDRQRHRETGREKRRRRKRRRKGRRRKKKRRKRKKRRRT